MVGKWRVLLGCILSYSAFHANRSALAIVLPVLVRQWGLTYSKATILASAYDLGYLSTLVLAGYLVSYINKKTAILIGLTFLAVSNFASTWFSDYEGLLVARLAAGVGFSIYFTCGHSLIADHFTSGKRGMAFGFHSTGSAFGRFYGAWLAGIMAGLWGWVSSFYALGLMVLIITGAVTLLFLLAGDNEIECSTHLSTTENSWGFLLKAEFWVPTAVNAFSAVSFIVLTNFLPFYLTDLKGLSLARTTALVAFTSLITMVSNPCTGLLADRFGVKPATSAVFFFASYVCLIPVLDEGKHFPAIVLVVLIGFFITANMPMAINLLSQGGIDYSSPLVIGFFNTITLAVALAFNLLAGFLADYWGLLSIFTLLALLNGLGAFGLGIWLIKAKRNYSGHQRNG